MRSIFGLYWHTWKQRFDDRRRGNHGRGSISVWRGNPDAPGNVRAQHLTTLDIEWHLFAPQHSIGGGVVVGDGDGEDGVTISMRVPWFGVYVSAERVVPRWLRSRMRNTGQKYPSARELAVSWHNGAVWWKLWCDLHESGSHVPIWDARSHWRSPVWHVVDWLFGRLTSHVEHVETHTATLHLPEGDYPVTVEITWRVRQRSRLAGSRRMTTTASVISETGIPIPGKGESAYDCDDDAYYQIGTPAETVDDALVFALQKIRERREEYGGRDWRPERAGTL